MRILFCCNVYFDGNLYKAGEHHNVADDVALKLERRGLIEALEPSAVDAPKAETVKEAPKVKTSAKKKSSKEAQ